MSKGVHLINLIVINGQILSNDKMYHFKNLRSYFRTLTYAESIYAGQITVIFMYLIIQPRIVYMDFLK